MVPGAVFNEERAATYDDSFSKMRSSRDSMWVFLSEILKPLPEDARILCVGVGTGNELIHLAARYPGWTFVGIDPSGPMLEVCRRKVVQAGISERCELHVGYLDSLAAKADFNAATCLLVSHFLMEESERRRLFERISHHLKPDGLLVSADLATAPGSANYRAMADAWFGLVLPEDASDETQQAARSTHGSAVSLFDPRELESLIQSAGFSRPVQLFQYLFIHGWVCRRLGSVR